DGLVIKSPCGDVVPRVKTVQAGGALAGYDVVVLACKAYDLDSAIGSLAPAGEAGGPEPPLLHGLRALRPADRRFRPPPLVGAPRVLGGSWAIAATLGAGGRIEHLNRLHRLVFGERDGRASERTAALAGLMKRAKFDSALSDDILLEMWEKFVLLATLAGMTC